MNKALNLQNAFYLLTALSLSACDLSPNEPENHAQLNNNATPDCVSAEIVAGQPKRKAYLVPPDPESVTLSSAYQLVTTNFVLDARKSDSRTRYFKPHTDTVRIHGNESEANDAAQAYCDGGEGELVRYVSGKGLPTMPPITVTPTADKI
jgi:hypothetical protein